MSDAIIPEREVEEQDLYHAKSWWTEKVFSQDAKIIGISKNAIIPIIAQTSAALCLYNPIFLIIKYPIYIRNNTNVVINLGSQTQG